MISLSDASQKRFGNASAKRHLTTETSLCHGFAQVLDPMRDVLDSGGLVANFALDAQRPPVADALECLHELLDVRLTLAERHFLAPLALDRRPVRVLDVDTTDVRGQ